MKEKGKGIRERGQGYLSQRDKGLPLDRGDRRGTEENVGFIKVKRGNPMLG